MSNIGKTSIIIKKDLEDTLRKIKGYKEERLSIIKRTIEIKESESINQFILIREISYDKKLFPYKKEESNNNHNNKITLKTIKTINYNMGLDIDVKELQDRYELNILNTFDIAKGQFLLLEQWGTLNKKLREMLDSVYLLEEKKSRSIELELTGIGYKIDINTKGLELTIGYSHTIKVNIPENIKILSLSPTRIRISPFYSISNLNNDNNILIYNGASYNDITQFANNILLWKSAKKDKYKHIGFSLHKP
jgi:ribosomal protein L6P/L9E